MDTGETRLRMHDRSKSIDDVREEIEVLQEMIDAALDNGAKSEDPDLTNLLDVLTKRRSLLNELEGRAS